MSKKKSKAGQDTASAGAKTARAAAKADPGTIYQLKITLKNVAPPIWRRVQTTDCNLGQLHHIIQVSMGWEESHLHLFRIGPTQYGALDQWESSFDDEETSDERKAKLSQFVSQGVTKFVYDYDMGDSWEHSIHLEKSPSAEPGARYPRCIDGARACPPEDCGGPWGYGNLLETLKNPKHKEHEEMLEWVGGEFDPEAFDADRVTKQLAQ